MRRRGRLQVVALKRANKKPDRIDTSILVSEPVPVSPFWFVEFEPLDNGRIKILAILKQSVKRLQPRPVLDHPFELQDSDPVVHVPDIQVSKFLEGRQLKHSALECHLQRVPVKPLSQHDVGPPKVAETQALQVLLQRNLAVHSSLYTMAALGERWFIAKSTASAGTSLSGRGTLSVQSKISRDGVCSTQQRSSCLARLESSPGA